MTATERYLDLRGQEICLECLSAEGHALLGELLKEARNRTRCDGFSRYWLRGLNAFKEAHGKTAEARTLLRIAEDLTVRLMTQSGFERLPDYRQELRQMCRQRYGTLRAMSAVIGLPVEVLEPALQRETHLSLGQLQRIVESADWTLRVLPLPRDIMDTRPENYARSPQLAFPACLYEMTRSLGGARQMAQMMQLPPAILDTCLTLQPALCVGMLDAGFGRIGYALRVIAE